MAALEEPALVVAAASPIAFEEFFERLAGPSRQIAVASAPCSSSIRDRCFVEALLAVVASAKEEPFEAALELAVFAEVVASVESAQLVRSALYTFPATFFDNLDLSYSPRLDN